MTTDTATNWHELGARRLSASTPEEYTAAARETPHPFAFRWGSCWTAIVQYQVEDYAAEIGFFLDGLGFVANALAPDFCMPCSPDRTVFLAFKPVPEGGSATPADTFRLGFMVEGIHDAVAELARRGIELSEPLEPLEPTGGTFRGALRTPNDVLVELWGVVESPTDSASDEAEDEPAA